MDPISLRVEGIGCLVRAWKEIHGCVSTMVFGGDGVDFSWVSVTRGEISSGISLSAFARR